MERGIPITAAGAKFGYAIETVAGTMPTTAQLITDITTGPDLNPQPEMIETTDTSCLNCKTYTDGLKDLSGASTYEANYTTLLKKVWSKLYTDSRAAEKDDKATWFFIQLSNGDTAAYKGRPSKLGVPKVSTNNLVTVNCYVAPIGEPEWVDETITFTEPTGE